MQGTQSQRLILIYLLVVNGVLAGTAPFLCSFKGVNMLLILPAKQRSWNGMEPTAERFGEVNFFLLYLVSASLPTFPFPLKENKISLSCLILKSNLV